MFSRDRDAKSEPWNETKIRLFQKGKWASFKQERERLKRDEGVDPVEARKLALRHVDTLKGSEALDDGKEVTDEAPALPLGIFERYEAARAAMPAGEEPHVSIREEVDWVSNRLCVDPDEVSPADAPSPRAFDLWNIHRVSSVMREKFHLSYVKPLMPSQSELQKEEALRDDGRDPADDWLRQLFSGAGPENSSVDVLSTCAEDLV